MKIILFPSIGIFWVSLWARLHNVLPYRTYLFRFFYLPWSGSCFPPRLHLRTKQFSMQRRKKVKTKHFYWFICRRSFIEQWQFPCYFPSTFVSPLLLTYFSFFIVMTRCCCCCYATAELLTQIIGLRLLMVGNRNRMPCIRTIEWMNDLKGDT